MPHTSKNQETHWLSHLLSASHTDELRTFLFEHYPETEPSAFTEIIILGAADEGERLATLCQSLNITVSAIVDDNPVLSGQTIHGITVKPSTDLMHFDKEIPVVIATHRLLNPIKHLKEKGFKKIIPFPVLQALYPEKFPEHMFYQSWLSTLFNHKEAIEKLYHLLADDLSKATLDAILAFRLTLNPELLLPVLDLNVYAPADLIQFSNNEIYVDGGTFDGDSIRFFIDRVHNQYERIYGFEPDTKTFQKLCDNFSHEPRVIPVNKGLYSEEKFLYFDNAGTRASILNHEISSGTKVPVTALDHYLKKDNRVTYIKMNIEGAEIPALHGAKQCIQQWHPKLGISVYHRPSDLWEIPFLIKQLNPDYDLYLRQQDGGTIEAVTYALV